MSIAADRSRRVFIARAATLTPLVLSASAFACALVLRQPIPCLVEASGGWLLAFMLMVSGPASAAAGLFVSWLAWG